MTIYIIIFLVAVIIGALFIKKQNKEHFYNAPSSIQGTGLFADKDYQKDSLLFKAIENDQTITETARKINHCNRPNTYLKREPAGWYIYAKTALSKDTELSIDYNDTPDFIKKPDPAWTC